MGGPPGVYGFTGVQGLRVEGWLLALLDLEEELGGVPKPQKYVE